LQVLFSLENGFRESPETQCQANKSGRMRFDFASRTFIVKTHVLQARLDAVSRPTILPMNAHEVIYLNPDPQQKTDQAVD
jgi:hypothetical protein